MEYYQPNSLQEALEVLAEKKLQAMPVAGGTDIVVSLNEGTLKKKCLVSITEISELKGIRRVKQRISIGPLTTFAELASNEDLKYSLPILPEAAIQAATPQVRNMGTIGGNLGTGSPAGDLLPPLLVLNAKISVASKAGARTLTLDKLLLGPKQVDVTGNELITEIVFDELPAVAGSWFIKLGKTKACAVSIASAAAVVILSEDGKRFQEVRVALGSLAPTAIRARSIEEALIDRPIEENEINKVIDLIKKDISPVTDRRATSWYRAEVAGPLAKKAILHATANALSQS